MKAKSILRSFLTLTAGTLLAVTYSHAATLTWDPDEDAAAVNPANGTWSTAAGDLFWNNGGGVANVPWTTGNEAVFGGAGGTYAIGVTAVTVQKLTFASTGYTLSAVAPEKVITMTPASGSPLLQVDSGVVASIGANVAVAFTNSMNFGQATGTTAAGTLNIDGAGAILRTGNNVPGLNFSGNGLVVNLKNGTIRNQGSGSATGSITVGNASGSDVTMNVSGGALTAAGTGGLIVGNLGKGTVTQTGALPSTSTITIGSASTLGLTLGRDAANESNNTFNLDGGTLNTPTVKKGSGTDPNAAVFNFNGGLLVANNTAPNATFMQGLSAANVKAGGAKIQNAQNITINQALLAGSPSGGLDKSGSGTLTLGGANTYTGTTNVTAGKLKLSTAGSSASNVVVAATFSGGTVVATDDGQHVSNGNFTLDPGAKLVIDYGTTVAGTFNAPLKVVDFTVGAGCALELEGTEILNVVPGQNYPLVNWTGTGPLDGTNFAPLILTNGFSVNLSVASNTLFATFTAPPPISWNIGDGTWDTSTPNWVDQADMASTFTNLQKQVLFGDATGAGANPVVTLDNVLSPLGVTMNSGSRNYTISGNGGIAGPAGLTLASGNTGTLTLATANTYSGPTEVIGGTLSLGDGGTGGSLATGSTISVSSGATFAVKQSDTVTQATDFGLITGAGGFVQNGGGTTQLGLPNTFTGPINITSGHLQIVAGGRLNGGAYAGAIAISLGSTFDYSGTASQTLSGIISGDGSLVKGGSSTLTLSKANTYTGATTVNAGVLSLGNLNALQNTSGITLGGASAATLSSSLTGITISAPITTGNTGVSSTIAFATSVSAAQGTINLNGAIGGNGNVIFSSPDVGASTGQPQFINLGTAGTWAGSTTLTTGNSQVAPRLVNTSGAANVLPVTTVLSMTGGSGEGTGRSLIFDLNGQNQELAGLQNTLAVDREQRVTSVDPATLTINNSADYAFGGTIGSGTDDGTAKITGAISLTKSGPAKFTLLGSHDYTGNTTVNQGILSQEAPNMLNETSTVTIATAIGAQLELNFVGTDEVDKLFFGSTQQPAGNYSASSVPPGATIPTARFIGAGILHVASNPASGYAGWADDNAGGQGPELDFDNDGVSNGVEFFMNAAAGFTANPQLNASNAITWPNGGNIPASAYGTQFVVQTSSNLSVWTNVESDDPNLVNTNGSLTYTLTGGSPRFVRLSVTPAQ